VDLGRGRAPAVAAAAALLALAPAAHAATVSVEESVLRVTAAPGEPNGLTVTANFADASMVVSDPGAPLTAGPGCIAAADGSARCSGADSVPIMSIEVDAGDLDDSVTVVAPLPARILGGDGNDTLAGGGGADFLDGGLGDDSIEVRDSISDSAWCGPGRDSVIAETLDALDLACERVDYGPPGQVGRVMSLTGGGRWVPIPGQTWARVDRRILADVLYLVRRYRVRITEGFGTLGHEPFGEHPLGLAVDIEPGPGGTWPTCRGSRAGPSRARTTPASRSGGSAGTGTTTMATRPSANPPAVARRTCTCRGRTHRAAASTRSRRSGSGG
jgi:hemolysin type calcium-binding protein